MTKLSSCCWSFGTTSMGVAATAAGFETIAAEFAAAAAWAAPLLAAATDNDNDDNDQEQQA